jgi:hypothetical protein
MFVCRLVYQQEDANECLSDEWTLVKYDGVLSNRL